ncbi:unnamed protein product [Acanthoscelides obtectus]|uniref:Uncharacterized protein n=1 Tax=Acanthoscelides obtectus TaxID=200917 RepID=A0A9P0VNK8_ACAOB|nr:unnamed protein product [Acanthoscelides obtectus]CAH2016452.1 unnamed protein product [Acanthoscelides obtectus]CAK1641137.1 hypothetical protein AOBTE_LOCUS12186 [Acanthoscelides obtectus]CAK1688220.1 hypothetical protein AOBTE_LOCUS36619 [Acanthoscelides obtectus]
MYQYWIDLSFDLKFLYKADHSFLADNTE